MKTEPEFERCLSLINCEIQPRELHRMAKRKFRSVTISRQSGSGGHAVAAFLVNELQSQESPDACPWAIFDKNLVERVLEEHNLPARLARFMPEDKISEMADTMDELFGLHPPSWHLVRSVSETILRLAERGNAIVIGRGSHLITAKSESVLHVRLIGSVEKRARHLQERFQLTAKAALEQLRKDDKARARYLRKYFDQNIDDPLLYHVILNTDYVSYFEAARVIAGMVLQPEQELAATEAV